MTAYDKHGRRTSWVSAPPKPKPPSRVWVSRQVGNYRVGRSVSPWTAFFLLTFMNGQDKQADTHPATNSWGAPKNWRVRLFVFVAIVAGLWWWVAH
jgi:hypothetical protein